MRAIGSSDGPEMRRLAEKYALYGAGPGARIAAKNSWTGEQVEVIELAAGREPMDYSVEARIARLESDVAHLRTDVADMKADLRSLRDKMDALRDSIGSVRESIMAVKVWGLGLGLTIAAGVLGTMARAFGWI